MENTFIDAQEMGRLHPDTFETPDPELLDLLVKGALVKVSNGEERFWAQITEVKGKKLKATVDNYLLGDYGYNYGDIIEFEKRHIYSIY